MKLLAILITNNAMTYDGAQTLRQAVLFVFAYGGNRIIKMGKFRERNGCNPLFTRDSTFIKMASSPDKVTNKTHTLIGVRFSLTPLSGRTKNSTGSREER